MGLAGGILGQSGGGVFLGLGQGKSAADQDGVGAVGRAPVDVRVAGEAVAGEVIDHGDRVAFLEIDFRDFKDGGDFGVALDVEVEANGIGQDLKFGSGEDGCFVLDGVADRDGDVLELIR